MFGFKQQLDAYLGQECIGVLGLTHDHELRFFYHASWQQHGYIISPHLPLDNSAAENQLAIKVFFQNLFPEGENLKTLLENFRLSRSNVFAIAQMLGLDLSGAMQLIMGSQVLPQKNIFRPVYAAEMEERLRHHNLQELIIWDGKLRLSLAGVHQKINLVVKNNGEMGFGDEGLCSTHILKFESSYGRSLVINEFQMMKLAQAIHLPVADVELRKFGEYSALLVKRFDREWAGERVMRRHVIDGCQALNLLPEYKYERHLGSGRDVAHLRDGASLPRLFSFCEQCINPAIAKRQLLMWVLFNVIIGNWDAHAKNVSFFISSAGIELAPAYDLISIRAYPEFKAEWAMALGDEFNAKSVGAYQLADFADSCELPRDIVAKTLLELCERVNKHLPSMEYDTFTEKLKEGIAFQIGHLQRQAPMIVKVIL